MHEKFRQHCCANLAACLPNMPIELGEPFPVLARQQAIHDVERLFRLSARACEICEDGAVGMPLPRVGDDVVSRGENDRCHFLRISLIRQQRSSNKSAMICFLYV